MGATPTPKTQPTPPEPEVVKRTASEVAQARNGAKNAALIAVSILALQDTTLAAKLEAFRAKQTADVLKAELN